MKAYFVCDQESRSEYFVIPEKDQFIGADKQTMHQFISAQPDFTRWQGTSLEGKPPEALGSVVATRKEDGDVCILEETLWQQRMVSLLATP